MPLVPPPQNYSTKSPSYIIAIALGIVYFLISSWKIDKIPPGLYVDEGVYGLIALDILDGKAGGAYFNRLWGVDSLYGYLAALSFKTHRFLYGENNFSYIAALRITSAFAGAFTVVGIYLLGSFIFTKNAGLLAAILACFSRWLINFSRISFQGILLPVVLVWGFYFFMRGMYFPRRKMLNFILAGIMGGLGFYAYLPYRLMPLMVLIFISLKIYTDKNFLRRNGKEIAVCFGTALIVSIPLMIHFVRYPQFFIARAQEVSVINDGLSEIFKNFIKTLGIFFVKGDINPRHNIPGSPILSTVSAVFFAGGVILLLRHLLKNWQLVKEQNREVYAKSLDGAVLLFLWLAISLVPSVFSKESPHALRIIGAIPPVFIMAGYFADNLFFTFIQNKKLSFFLAILLVGISSYDGLHSYFSVWAKDERTKQGFGYYKMEIAQQTLSLSGKYNKVILPLSFWVDPSVCFLARSTYNKNNWAVAHRPESFLRDGEKNKFTDGDENLIYLLSRTSRWESVVSDIFIKIYPASRRVAEIKGSDGKILYEYRVIPAHALKDEKNLPSELVAELKKAFDYVRAECEVTPWLKDQLKYLD